MVRKPERICRDFVYCTVAWLPVVWIYEAKDNRRSPRPDLIAKHITKFFIIKIRRFNMNTTNADKTKLNGQAVQEQVTQLTPCRKDIKESVRSWFHMICGEKYYLEICHMLRMAVTSDYLNGLDMQNLPEPEAAGAELLQRTADAFRAFKEIIAEEEGSILELDIPDELAPYQVAKLIQVFFHAVQFSRREIYGDDYMRENMYRDDEDIALMVYSDKHPCDDIFDKTGLYIEEDEEIGEMVLRIDPSYETYTCENFWIIIREIEFWLQIFAKKVKDLQKIDNELVPIKNGILNCRTKKLMPFSPEYLLTDKYSYNLEYVESENGPVIQDFRDRTVSYTVDEWIKKFRAERKKWGLKNSGGGN